VARRNTFRIEGMSTCGKSQSSTRVFTLLELMNSFHIQALAMVLHEIEAAESVCMMQKLLGHGNGPIDASVLEQAKKALKYSENFFSAYPIKQCAEHVRKAKEQWNRPIIDASAANEILHRLTVDMVAELEGVEFLQVAADRMKLIDRDDLFGARVNEMFGSTTRDIREAGNCLAAECPTAAVFHLMRASEIALRVLARDRNVAFKDKPLEQKQWGEILGALEGIVKELREGDSKRWLNLEVRDVQIRFYNEVLQEFRGFNEAWRKHLSHAHPDSIYDRDYAMSVFKHVRAFMQKLASKIGEGKTTPEFWG
jgi:hypothetical protein